MKFSIKDFFSKYDQILSFTFTEEMFYEKLHFLCRRGLPIHDFIKSGLEGGGIQNPFAIAPSSLTLSVMF